MLLLRQHPIQMQKHVPPSFPTHYTLDPTQIHLAIFPVHLYVTAGTVERLVGIPRPAAQSHDSQGGFEAIR